MAADVVFVLILTVVCLGLVIGMAIHSRRQKPLADQAAASDAKLPEEPAEVASASAGRRASGSSSRRRR